MAQHAEDYNPDQNIDQQYIQSYGEDFSVHKLMLSDGPRMEFYSKAIIQAAAEKKAEEEEEKSSHSTSNNTKNKKFVIDCGAGSGVLSMIALRCGFDKVYSIEASDRVAQTILPNIKRNFAKLFSSESVKDACNPEKFSTRTQAAKAVEREILKKFQLHQGMAEDFPVSEVVQEIIDRTLNQNNGKDNNNNNNNNNNSNQSPVREDDSDVQQGSSSSTATNTLTATIYLVSEWMGFYLLHEAMLNSVIHLRDRLLKEINKHNNNNNVKIELKMIPDVAEIYTAPFDLHRHFDSSVKPSWNFLDLDFSFLGEVETATLFSTERNPVIQVVHGNSLLLPGQRLISLDLTKVTVDELEQLELSATFEFPSDFAKTTGAGKGAALNGFVMWFSCFYAGCEEERRLQIGDHHRGGGVASQEDASSDEQKPKKMLLELPTSPCTAPTHWKQTVVMLSDEGVPAEDIAGDTMTAKFTLVRDQRVYEIGLELE